jgi:S1-C subfamily serine protease
VMVVGYPLSRLQDGRAVPQAAAGRVRRAGGEMLELDAALHPGNSGGPVLGLDGRVVGMASAILDSPVYGLALPEPELEAARQAAQQSTLAQQRHLRALGCYAGPMDGVPGSATLAALPCSAGIRAGL